MESVATVSQSYAERASRLAFILEQPNTLEILCHKVMEGESVKEIARSWDVPHGKLSGWLLADRERYEQYCRAQQVHAHTLVEEAVGIADAANADDKAGVLKARLQVDVRFRTAAHHAKDRYGEQAAKGGGTRVQVIVQRSQTPQPEAVQIAASQGDEHGDHLSADANSPR
jgi:terminase small subunit-like protein